MVDFREKAPGSASETMFVNDKNASQVGGRAMYAIKSPQNSLKIC
jgi:gamma-glutamyltranspeptidase